MYKKPLSDCEVWLCEDFLFKNVKGYNYEQPRDPNKQIRLSLIYFSLKCKHIKDERLKELLWDDFKFECLEGSIFNYNDIRTISILDIFTPTPLTTLKITCDLNGVPYKTCRRYIDDFVLNNIRMMKDNKDDEVFGVDDYLNTL